VDSGFIAKDPYYITADYYGCYTIYSTENDPHYRRSKHGKDDVADAHSVYLIFLNFPAGLVFTGY